MEQSSTTLSIESLSFSIRFRACCVAALSIRLSFRAYCRICICEKSYAYSYVELTFPEKKSLCKHAVLLHDRALPLLQREVSVSVALRDRKCGVSCD